MKHDLMWTYYICLSTHMWDDGYGNQRYPYLPAASMGCMYPYTEENHIDLGTWDKMMRYLADHRYNTVMIDVGDAIRWESHPEIVSPNAWDKEFAKKKLDEIRALGITPIPGMNFSACHHAWLKEYRRMVGTALYRNACADLIAEACELFGKPEFFFLSLDEESSFDCHAYREATIVRGERLMWEDYHFLMDACRKNGARPWMCADYSWDRRELWLKYVPKDVLVSNWYYEHFKNYAQENWLCRAMKTYEWLDEQGYEQLPLMSTCAGVNSSAYETLTHCKAHVSPDRLRGYMTAAWVYTMPDELLTLQNDAYRLYAARRDVYPETL